MILKVHAPWRCDDCGSAMKITSQVEGPSPLAGHKLLMSTGHCEKNCKDRVLSKLELKEER